MGDNMKIMTVCTECLRESIDPSKDPSKAYNYLEVTSESLYFGKCKYNHDISYSVQGTGFETLFELGILALNEGFTREAISSFAVAIERCHEFILKVLMLEMEVGMDHIEETWKYVSPQSERQLGAFYFCYLATINEVPPKISNNKMQFRNNVIHKGYIPTVQEASGYEKFAYNYILQLLIKVKETCNPNHIFEVMVLNQKNYNKNPIHGEIKTISTSFNLFGSDSPLEIIRDYTYENQIAKFLKNQEGFYPKYKK